MEREFERYNRQVADLGGIDEVIRKSNRGLRAPAIGFSKLFTSTFHCANYNAQYTPRNVEFFLMMVMTDVDAFTRAKLDLFGVMSESENPVIKAYGLWFLAHEESGRLKIWNYEEMHDGSQYPHIEAYRTYVYEQAKKGQEWAYGFAADAVRFDLDMPRIIDALIRYEHALGEKWRESSVDDYLGNRIFDMAFRSEEEFSRLNAEQKSFINLHLDRELLTKGYRPNLNVPRMFEIMNRRSEIPVYKERLELVGLIDELWRIEDRPKEAILMRNPHRARLLEDFMERCLETGDFKGYSEYSMRQLFEIMGRKGDFDAAFPGKGRL